MEGLSSIRRAPAVAFSSKSGDSKKSKKSNKGKSFFNLGHDNFVYVMCHSFWGRKTLCGSDLDTIHGKTEVCVVQGTYPLTSAVVSEPAGVCFVPVSYCVMLE